MKKLNWRKLNRQRLLERSLKGVEAKRLKRERAIAEGWTPEPKMVRAYPLEFGVRNKATGEVAWTDLKSVRDAAKRIGMVLKYY